MSLRGEEEGTAISCIMNVPLFRGHCTLGLPWHLTLHTQRKKKTRQVPTADPSVIEGTCTTLANSPRRKHAVLASTRVFPVYQGVGHRTAQSPDGALPEPVGFSTCVYVDLLFFCVFDAPLRPLLSKRLATPRPETAPRRSRNETALPARARAPRARRSARTKCAPPPPAARPLPPRAVPTPARRRSRTPATARALGRRRAQWRSPRDGRWTPPSSSRGARGEERDARSAPILARGGHRRVGFHL